MPATLDRKYEKFQGGPTLPPETRVHVSIDRRGVITLNATCYKLLGKLGPPERTQSNLDLLIQMIREIQTK